MHVDAKPFGVLWIRNDLLYIWIQFFKLGPEREKIGFTNVHKVAILIQNCLQLALYQKDRIRFFSRIH
jgi:hypothetical protein